jgi:hypothetical protein
MNEYKGYSLFNDIEDLALRTRNRGVTLANIAEDHTKNKKINAKGVSLILNYYALIPAEESVAVRESFAGFMKERGYATA